MNPYIPLATTLLIFLVGTFFTIRHYKVVRTISYIERVNNPSMVSIRADVDEWLMADSTIPEKLDKLKSDQKLKIKVTLLYNIFTELAIAHNNRIVNRRLCYKIWFPIIPMYWWRMKFYIDDCKKNGSPIGDSLEKFTEKIEAYNFKKGDTLSDPLADRLKKELTKGST